MSTMSSLPNSGYLTHVVDDIPYPLTVVLPIERVARWWQWLSYHAHRYYILPELLLAVTLVETALFREGGSPDALSPMAPHVLARDDVSSGLMTEPPDLPLLPELLMVAAVHLSLQCIRFEDGSLALVAYHTDPDQVDDMGDPVLDVPVHQAYVRAVWSTFAWLCQTRPWRAWYPAPAHSATHGGSHGS